MATQHMAKSRKGEAADKVGELHHLEVHHAANGGHIIHHMHEHPMGGMIQHETHAFGPEEHHMALGHIADHMGMEAHVSQEPVDEDEGEGREDTEAGEEV